jgi:hypothetical protein
MSIQNDSHTATVQLPTGVATAGDPGDIYVINRLGGKAKVANVDFIADTNITANNSNNATFTVTVSGTSLGSIQTTTGGTGDITAGVNEPITLSGAGSNLVAEGGLVKVAITKTGTGVAVKGVCAVTIERVRAD